jgi:hypothetical protein
MAAQEHDLSVTVLHCNCCVIHCLRCHFSVINEHDSELKLTDPKEIFLGWYPKTCEETVAERKELIDGVTDDL